MKRIFYTLIALLVIAVPVFAAEDGGQESAFSVGVGARALGMGGGFVSLADDATAVFYNPAGLPTLQSQEFSFMHMRLFEGTTLNYGAWALPTLSYGGLGISYARIGTDDLVRRTNFIENGTFGYSQTQFQVSYGHYLIYGASLGASLKVVRQTIDTYADNGIGLDAGFLVPVYRNLSFGVVVRNAVQATLRLKETDEKTPISVLGGFGLRDFKVTKGVLLTASAEGEQTERRKLKLHTGLELLFAETYALRAGYDRNQFSFGAGLKYRRISFDYAYKIVDNLEDSHRFSVSFAVGTSITDQRKRQQIKREQEGSQIIAGDRQRQFQYFRSLADTNYAKFELDSALQNYERALAYDPNNQEIIGTIAAIKDALETKRATEQQISETARTRQISVSSLLGQAESLYRRTEYGAAKDLLAQIDSLDATNADAHTLRVKIDDAIQTEITAEQQSARQAGTEGNLVAVIQHTDRILKLDSTNTEAKEIRQQALDKLTLSQLLSSGLDLYKLGKYEDARDRFKRLLERDAGQPVAIEYINKIDRALAKPPTLEELQQDKDIWPLYLEGLRFMREREYQKAIDMWEKVLEKYPNNHNTLDNIEQARLRLQSEGGK